MMSNIVHIHEKIRQRIVQEVYKPLQKLSETALAEEFHCSRTPIRQVLQQLQKENFVTIVPKSGTYVKERSSQQQRYDIEVRAYLEGLAYRLCIENNTSLSTLIDKLRSLYDRMHTCLSSLNIEAIQDYTTYHYQFHESIIEASHNPLLIKLFGELHLADRPSFLKKMTLEDIVITEKEHLAIITYLKNRDPEGEQFMISHLYNKNNVTE